ncbi:MAG: DMT family transporter [bacterium]
MLNVLLFSALCLSWGSTWVAIKIGVERMPPLFYAGTRFMVAGVLIFVLAWIIDGRDSLKIKKGDGASLVWLSALVISICFSLIFWGEKYVSASLTAILVQGMIPIFLPWFSVLLLKEKISTAGLLSIAIGIAGLVIVFLPSVRASLSTDDADGAGLLALYGLIAVVVGTLSYCYGSVKIKPILSRHSAIAISGWQNFIGGALTLAFSFAFEVDFDEVMPLLAGASSQVLYAWAWLVIVGSLLGFVLYVVLLKSWGATKLSPYAFVTPIVAIVIEYLLHGELIRLFEAVGMVVLFVAVYLALRNPEIKRPRWRISRTRTPRRGKRP